MEIKAYKLNAFTQSISGGNPAGVVLDADIMNEAQMQELAALLGFSETVFVSKSNKADYKVRFFTPCAEVDLCGHGTIAAFGLMLKKGMLKATEYTQETKAGILKIRIEGDTIYMQQAMPQFSEIIERQELGDCLEIPDGALEQKIPVQIVSTGLKDILVPVKSKEILEQLRPDMKKLEEISKKYNAVGLHVFAIEEASSNTAVCRNFAPLYGIPEEAATGTSNGALACYLYKYGIIDGSREAVFLQGIYMNKPSCVKARLNTKGGSLEEIWVGGEAVLWEEAIYQLK